MPGAEKTFSGSIENLMTSREHILHFQNKNTVISIGPIK